MLGAARCAEAKILMDTDERLARRLLEMTKKFDWIPDSNLKIEIIQAWEDYQRVPQVWRLNHYLSLVESVPIERDYLGDDKYCVRFGDSHQECSSW